MGFLRKNWRWIVAPILLFALIVAALNLMGQESQGYAIR